MGLFATINCRLYLVKEKVYEDIGNSFYSKVCKVQDGRFYVAILWSLLDTSTVKFAILDNSLNLLNYSNKGLKFGYEANINPTKGFIEFYGVASRLTSSYESIKNFRVERFDYEFNSIYHYEDTSLNNVRFIGNNISYLYKRGKSNDFAVVSRLYDKPEKGKIIYFVDFFDSTGKFFREVVFDTIDAVDKLKIFQFLNHNDNFFYLKQLPADTINYPKDSYYAKYFSPNLDSILFSGRIQFVETEWNSRTRYLNFNGFVYLLTPWSLFGNYKVTLAKIDDKGFVAKARTYEFDTNYNWLFLTQTILSDGSLLWAGRRYGKDKEICGFLWKVDQNLESEELFVFSCGKLYVTIASIMELENGNLLLTGSLENNFWVALIGFLSDVEVHNRLDNKIKIEKITDLTNTFKLKANSFARPEFVKIYNLLGREVMVLKELDWFQHYDNEFDWSTIIDLSSLPRGVYFVSVQVAPNNILRSVLVVE